MAIDKILNCDRRCESYDMRDMMLRISFIADSHGDNAGVDVRWVAIFACALKASERIHITGERISQQKVCEQLLLQSFCRAATACG